MLLRPLSSSPSRPAALTLLSMSLVSALVSASRLAAQDPSPALDPNAAAPVQRIWSADTSHDAQAWFRRTFEIGKGVRSIRITFSCDNECAVFFNGVRVAEADDWQKLTVVDLEVAAPGKQVVAVHAKNHGGPAALALWITWTDGTRKLSVGTDRGWRVSSRLVAAWKSVAFDDRNWVLATESGASRYGMTVYNSAPVQIVRTMGLAALLDEIERGLKRVRAAQDRVAALEALRKIQRAVVRARRVLEKRAR